MNKNKNQASTQIWLSTMNNIGSNKNSQVHIDNKCNSELPTKQACVKKKKKEIAD